MAVFDWIKYHLSYSRKFEHKLRIYHGYRHNSIGRWKKQLNLPSSTVNKILCNLRVISAVEMRNMLRDIVLAQSSLFNNPNCYICKFGLAGKSGDVVLYELEHGCAKLKSRIVELWKIPWLPANSTIIFVDDLVGTGKQSSDFINSTINSYLNPSHVPILMSVCATPQGTDTVKNNTNFGTICNLVLDECNYQFSSEKSVIFNNKEKTMISEINKKVNGGVVDPYDKGLLIAFFYSVPNNTMPFLWKDGFKYRSESGNLDHWFALLPRSF